MTKKAFSLLELSIVVVIIGVLIASTIGASVVVQKSRLSKARSLSNGSPVTSIDNLILWFDASSTKAFKDEDPRDGTAIDTWFDTQNSLSTKTNLGQPNSTRTPTYAKSAIGGLPALYFNGTSATLFGSRLPLSSANYSIFIVLATANLGTAHSDILTIYNDDGNFTNSNAKNGMLLEMSDGTKMRALHRSRPMGSTGGDSNVTATNSFSSNKSYILSCIRNFDNSTLNLWLNEVLVMGSGSTFIPSPAVTNGPFELSPLSITVGSLNDNLTNSRYFKGHISEIIIFDRALEQDEIDDVKSYLSKKYSIRIN